MVVESGAAMVAGFLLGAFPTAYLVCRRLADRDLRRTGSGNPGALNAYRQFGKVVGLFVLIVDTGKGALAVFVGLLLGVSDLVLYASVALTMLGHNFSPFVGFRGGKGAATVFGISAVMLWQITAVTAGAEAVMFAATRHAGWSLGTMFVLLNALTIGTGQFLPSA